MQRVVFPASPVPLLRPPRTFALHTWGTLPGGCGWRLAGSSYPPRSYMSFSCFRWGLILW